MQNLGLPASYSSKDIMLFLDKNTLQADVPHGQLVRFAIVDCQYAHAIRRVDNTQTELLEIESQLRALESKLKDRAANKTFSQADIEGPTEQLRHSLSALVEQNNQLRDIYSKLKGNIGNWHESNQDLAKKIVESPSPEQTLRSAPMQIAIQKAFTSTKELTKSAFGQLDSADLALKHARKTIENTLARFPGLAEVITALQQEKPVATTSSTPTPQTK